ncbi:MAG: hypothetical protein JJ971_15685 [Balneolaceae bacterium]|nr:hypothetical protein [Balneolaceae bacterium]MBO6547842.1 hypothetical protein [Balneolaceae bacterium]MBO6648353.1 hypothetical protein [Balneolaceae bacterium]
MALNSILLLCIFSCSHPNEVVSQIPEQVERYTLPNGMIIDVYTPLGVSSEQSYPLLIINDGEVVFNQTSWNLTSKLNMLIETNEIEPVITVAIHTNGNRNDWYIPYLDSWIIQNWGHYTPSSKEYATAIFEIVIPFIKKQYKIEESRIGIMGASLGGLLSTWIGIHYPEHIRYSASLSGSFWVNDYQIFKEVDSIENLDQKFWFDIGTKEWNYYVPFYRALDEQGLEPGIQNFYYEVPDARHTDADWVKRIHLPLKLFYGTNPESVPESMEVHLECIPSQSVPGRKFRRLNPVVTLTNGVRFSLAHKATYELESGEVQFGSEGSLLNNPDIESKILITYKELSDNLTIPVNWCR